MGIDAVVESTEGMDQSIASLYTQDAATGKWRLDVNGGFKTPSEIEGLSSALGKERSRAEAAEKALKVAKGPAAFTAALVDALAALTPADVQKLGKVMVATA